MRYRELNSHHLFIQPNDTILVRPQGWLFSISLVFHDARFSPGQKLILNTERSFLRSDRANTFLLYYNSNFKSVQCHWHELVPSTAARSLGVSQFLKAPYDTFLITYIDFILTPSILLYFQDCSVLIFSLSSIAHMFFPPR